jgi:hypothetical protein
MGHVTKLSRACPYSVRDSFKLCRVRSAASVDVDVVRNFRKCVIKSVYFTRVGEYRSGRVWKKSPSFAVLAKIVSRLNRYVSVCNECQLKRTDAGQSGGMTNTMMEKQKEYCP